MNTTFPSLSELQCDDMLDERCLTDSSMNAQNEMQRPGAESMLSDPSPSGSGDGAAQLTEADEVAALVEGADAGVTESVKGATSDLADLFSLQLQIDTTKADIKSIEGQLRVLKEADKLPHFRKGRIGVGGRIMHLRRRISSR